MHYMQPPMPIFIIYSPKHAYPYTVEPLYDGHLGTLEEALLYRGCVVHVDSIVCIWAHKQSVVEQVVSAAIFGEFVMFH